MRTNEEVATKYWCHNCKSKVDTPNWKDIKENIMAAYCPRCGEEVARRLKTNDYRKR